MFQVIKPESSGHWFWYLGTIFRPPLGGVDELLGFDPLGRSSRDSVQVQVGGAPFYTILVTETQSYTNDQRVAT